MNGFDIFIVIVVSFGLLRGFFRGFIREIASIIGVVAGFYGAYTYYKLLSVYLNPLVNDWGFNNWETYGNIASFFILFFGILALTSLIANIIKYLLKLVFLAWIDKLFGMIFGAIKGILLSAVVLTVLTAFLPNQPEFITKSILAPYVINITEMSAIFIPKDLKGNLKTNIERIKEIWEQQKLSVQEKMTERVKKNMTDPLEQKINETGKEKILEKTVIPDQPKQ
ncbi:MAG: CvpA family protein [Desulfamplus sp.]|nr:CvpA family protein [Desulfamplus sp.]MBF0413118.1 CvpA family protein [Desulfamplus sp.]